MRPPGNSARSTGTYREGCEAGEDLHHEPDPQIDDGRQADKTAEDEDGNKSYHPGGGVKDEISAHDRRNGAAGSQCGEDGGGLKDILHQGCAESAQQIEKQVAEGTQPVFDIVAEDHQEPHVADEVVPASVQEHVGEERQQGSGIAEADIGRREGKRGNELVGKA